MYEIFEKFDTNEYIITGFCVLLIAFFFILPKRFPTVITVIILIFGSFSARFSDVMLFPFDFYDVMDHPKHSIFDLVLYTFCYPFYVYHFCYFYDKIKLDNGFQVLHIFIWTIIAVVLEYLGIKLEVYTYFEWRLYYSVIVYFIVFSGYVLMLQTVLSYYQKHWGTDINLS